MSESDKYADMLNMPHPEPDPVRHPRMSRESRAAQFAPFAALTGFEEMIGDAAKLHNSKE